MSSSVLQEFVILSLKALTSYGFKVSILLCDGASSNLTVLKLLSGYPNAQFPVRSDAETPRECYYVEASFVNPDDLHGNPVFLMICPTHQVFYKLCVLCTCIILGLYLSPLPLDENLSLKRGVYLKVNQTNLTV